MLLDLPIYFDHTKRVKRLKLTLLPDHVLADTYTPTSHILVNLLPST